jgi:hypothetical protein
MSAQLGQMVHHSSRILRTSRPSARLILRFSVDEKYVTDIYTGRLNFFRRPIKAARQAKNHVGGGCELLD